MRKKDGLYSLVPDGYYAGPSIQSLSCPVTIIGCAYAFSGGIKDKIRATTGGTCIVCGNPICDCHHILPLSMGGSNKQSNGVPLCSEHHNYWDNLALVEGILYPGVPVERAQKEQVGDKRKHHKSVRKKRKGNPPNINSEF